MTGLTDGLLAIIDESCKASDAWRKCMKRYGADDVRTRDAYNKFLGLEQAREILMDMLENMADRRNEHENIN